jgi:hypothetical protein
MTEILVLCTWWEPNYWERDKTAPYTQKSIEPVQHLIDKTPLPGIGVYTKGKGRDYTHRAPCFLIIKNISKDEKGQPHFDFHYVSRIHGLTSAQFLNEIPKKDLFFSVSEEDVISVLQKFNIKPPPEWQNLLEVKAPPVPSWLDWVGAHFKDIIEPISNNEYEDRIAEIFTALGFEVEQLGHRKEGEYPDGIAYTKDFAIIYDCKNRTNYFLNASDKRAIIKYVQYAKPRIEERRKIEKIYFAIIAHSYDKVENISDIEKETSSKGFLLTSEAMLYLLFTKISLGPAFLLADFQELISNQVITIENVKNVYRG